MGGGSLTTGAANRFALRGGGNNDFWRYNISGNSWQSLTDAPDSVGWGGALAFDGSDTIYALGGAGKKSLWKYNISPGAWSFLADTPSNVGDGGACCTTRAMYILSRRITRRISEGVRFPVIPGRPWRRALPT